MRDAGIARGGNALPLFSYDADDVDPVEMKIELETREAAN